ncbi:hypothetical protein CapIbe_022028 [Capra ibex]
MYLKKLFTVECPLSAKKLLRSQLLVQNFIHLTNWTRDSGRCTNSHRYTLFQQRLLDSTVSYKFADALDAFSQKHEIGKHMTSISSNSYSEENGFSALHHARDSLMKIS